jgi:hypothetical protein
MYAILYAEKTCIEENRDLLNFWHQTSSSGSQFWISVSTPQSLYITFEVNQWIFIKKSKKEKKNWQPEKLKFF